MKKILVIFLIAMSFGLYAADKDFHSITVTGQGTTKVKANIADVRIGVQVDGKSAINVQEALADKVKPVMSKLKQLQVDKLETSSMSIFPQYNNKNDPPTLIGYKGSVEISFSSDITNAGPAIDAAIGAGANQMQGFSVRSADDVKKQAKLTALQQASNNGLVEAKAVLSSLNLEAGEIQQISVDQVNIPTPIFRKAVPMAFAASQQTELTEQEQEINAMVTLQIGIKPKDQHER